MNEIGRKIVDKLIELHGSLNFIIAFLPYKRSMWNSMESVFEECRASGIEAHCMPIPYYCMDENHEVDHAASDYDLFGDIAEPIGELERIHPDYIAIHYQYEDHNKVTNMLPEYFTSVLKEKYQCKIIYLPYGIFGNQPRYALQPGCRDVDYAFLESDDAVNLFLSGWQTQGVDFSGRVFSFGSAKLDAMGKLKREIPEEWADIIGDRSVTLVCNSLGPFLSDPGRLTLYRHYISNELGAGRAVIFRPHPLMRATIKSMRPGQAQAYDAFMSWAHTRDRVIVDESEYLERALGIADRLISDPSSVLTMWQATDREWEVMG